VFDPKKSSGDCSGSAESADSVTVRYPLAFTAVKPIGAARFELATSLAPFTWRYVHSHAYTCIHLYFGDFTCIHMCSPLLTSLQLRLQFDSG